MSDEVSREKKLVDIFELAVAILLGLGAVGGAWAAYQGDLWSGQSTEAYGEAATLTTQASTLFNTQVSTLMRDLNLELNAKQSIFEAVHSADQTVKLRAFDVARWIYTLQMSDEAYRSMGLDMEYRTSKRQEQVEMRQELEAMMKQAPEKQPTDQPEETPPPSKQIPEQGQADEEQIENEDDGNIPEPLLIYTIFRNIAEDENYINAVFTEATEVFRQADAKFESGRNANETGDKFGFDVVLFTVALFLGGVALVFKTRVRWAFAGLGYIVLLVAIIYLFLVPWAG
jgi:hypothetical protein